MNSNPAGTPDLDARSPWSSWTGVAAIDMGGPAGVALTGSVRLPGSKSYTNRALLLAAAANGVSRIEGILRSDDSYWCIDALRRLGVTVDVEGDVATVTGTGGRWPVSTGSLYVGAAGTVARFLPGLLAASPSGDWRLTASAGMTKRPMKTLLDALAALGASLEWEGEPGSFPFRLRANGLSAGRVSVPSSTSSQFLSGLLMAASLASGPVEIRVDGGIVQHAYVRMTVDMIARFGGRVSTEDFQLFRTEPAILQGGSVPLEPDVSAAGYFFALAGLHGGELTLEGIHRSSGQPDIGLLDILERMGCRFDASPVGLRARGPQRLQGGFTISMKELSDQALTVGALAVFADGPVEVREVAHIRAHESDRIKALCENLSRLKIRTEELADGFRVYPGVPEPAVLDSFDDHRVAMAMALIGTRVAGIRITDPGCVSKTFPDYFSVLQGLGFPFHAVSA